MEEDRRFFIGEKKIKIIETTELTTPAGGSIVNVIYDNKDGEELMTLARLEETRTFKKTDATKVRERLIKGSGKKMYALLMEYGPYLYEVDHILNEVVRLSNDATEQATGILWGKDHPSQRSLLDVNNILLKHYEQHRAEEVPTEEDQVDGTSPERDTVDTPDTERN